MSTLHKAQPLAARDSRSVTRAWVSLGLVPLVIAGLIGVWFTVLTVVGLLAGPV